MQYTGHNAAEWITNVNPAHVRHASYGLSVDKVIVDGEELKPIRIGSVRLGPFGGCVRLRPHPA